MPSILEDLQNEFKSKLGFYNKGIKNITRPGQPIRVGDKIKFTIFAKNYSAVTMKNVGGWIQSAPATSFTAVGFSIPNLAPGMEKACAGEIEANVIADTNDAWWFDKIATISASAEADLSTFRFSDTGIIVTVVLPP